MEGEGVEKIKVFPVFSSERAEKVFFYQHLENWDPMDTGVLSLA